MRLSSSASKSPRQGFDSRLSWRGATTGASGAGFSFGRVARAANATATRSDVVTRAMAVRAAALAPPLRPNLRPPRALTPAAPFAGRGRLTRHEQRGGSMLDIFDLTGKVALVTGATRGVGRGMGEGVGSA